MASIFAVYGASGCGRGIMPLAREQLARTGAGTERLVFIDDHVAEREVNGHRIMTWAQFLEQDETERRVAIAIADPEIRKRIAERCQEQGVGFWSVRAHNVTIMDDVVISEGALISPFVTITSNIRIGRHFHANIGSYVEHDCRIGDFVTFAPGVKCNGNVVIEDYAYIGAGAILKQGRPGAPLVIGRGAVVGMGAVVTRSVAPGVTAVGNPARSLMRAKSGPAPA